MTEYDFSPEAYAAYERKLRGIDRWRMHAAAGVRAPNPFVPLPGEHSDDEGRDDFVHVVAPPAGAEAQVSQQDYYQSRKHKKEKNRKRSHSQPRLANMPSSNSFAPQRYPVPPLPNGNSSRSYSNPAAVSQQQLQNYYQQYAPYVNYAQPPQYSGATSPPVSGPPSYSHGSSHTHPSPPLYPNRPLGNYQQYHPQQIASQSTQALGQYVYPQTQGQPQRAQHAGTPQYQVAGGYFVVSASQAQPVIPSNPPVYSQQPAVYYSYPVQGQTYAPAPALAHKSKHEGKSFLHALGFGGKHHKHKGSKLSRRDSV